MPAPANSTRRYKVVRNLLPGLVGVLLCTLLTGASAWGVELAECRKLYQTGEYADCIEQTALEIEKGRYGEDWRVLKCRAELVLGRHLEAATTVETGLKRYSWSIQLRLLGHEAALRVDDLEAAAAHLKAINEQATRYPWRYIDTPDLVTLGEAALVMGADARDVLEAFYDRARKRDPKSAAPLIAGGELALGKNDMTLAAEFFGEAQKLAADDPEVRFGLARVLVASEPARAAVEFEKLLEENPNHLRCMLLKVDRLIDAEEYDQADVWITRILEVDNRHPRAWAYRSVLAQLKHDEQAAVDARTTALSTWSRDPQVDHLIGRKLSQNYRFTEGAAAQRQALEFDSKYLPAKIQLSQDLLRLGQEDEGWKQAQQVYDTDGYDVVTFNLVELRDRIAKFRTLSDDHFLLRMDAREADIYGEAAMKLLNEARETLCAKYKLELKEQVTVEIFPDPNDFAVRTFGMPATSGYLGVCFGKVITANSPASQFESPANWRSVLWHEFCHVVTLQLTHNRIPRWLSEGISVYEERLENPTWGQSMDPRYREAILGDQLTPVGNLSSAFLTAQSGWHLQFAYFESALAVEFLVESYGREALRNVLHDLGAGIPINVALERRTVPLGELETGFEEFAKQKAGALAPKADWERHDLEALLSDDGNELELWAEKHPTNVIGVSLYVRTLIAGEQWEKAEIWLKRLIELYPEDTSHNNASLQLASVYRKQEQFDDERTLLKQYSLIDGDALAVYLRLLELEAEAEDWKSLLETSNRALAVNPLVPQVHRLRAQAAESLKQPDAAIGSYRALLALDPEDPAEVHFRLATLLHERKDATAKRHVLAALEEAPRYRAAHRLLLKIVGNASGERGVSTP